MIPNWLMRRPEISQGAKLCYGRMCQFNGENGKCFPKQITLAEELGVSERQINAYIAELGQAQLISIIRPGLGQSNTYEFLWHGWIEQPTSDQTRRILPLRTEECFASEQKNTSDHTREENHRRESVKENKAPPELKIENSFSPKPYTGPLPETLDVPEFRIAWNDYEQYLREKRKPITASTRKYTLADCEAWGVAAAILSIKQTISCQYPGLYPPKDGSRPARAKLSSTPNNGF